jgi:hypothetical protein
VRRTAASSVIESSRVIVECETAMLIVASGFSLNLLVEPRTSPAASLITRLQRLRSLQVLVAVIAWLAVWVAITSAVLYWQAERAVAALRKQGIVVGAYSSEWPLWATVVLVGVPTLLVAVWLAGKRQR